MLAVHGVHLAQLEGQDVARGPWLPSAVALAVPLLVVLV